jgi:hypothetical protein
MPIPLAGPAALSIIIGELKSMISSIFGALTSAFHKLSSTILDTVAAFRPFQIKIFERAVLDLKAVFGMIFLPVLQTVTRYVRLLANYFLSLPPAFRTVLQVGAKVLLVVGAVAIVLGVVAGLIPVLIAITTPVMVFVGALSALFVMFARTTGGANFLKEAWITLEQVIASIFEKVKSGWAELAPLRAELSAAFSDLGDSMTELLNSINPLIEAFIKANAILLTAIIKSVVIPITLVVKALAFVVGGWANIFNALRKLGVIGGGGLPDVSREQKSAFGLGAQGGTITSDVAGMKTKLEEAILANTGREEEKTPEQETATNTGDMADTLKEIKEIADKLWNFSVLDESKKLGNKIGNVVGERLGQIIFGP